MSFNDELFSGFALLYETLPEVVVSLASLFTFFQSFSPSNWFEVCPYCVTDFMIATIQWRQLWESHLFVSASKSAPLRR